MTKSLEHDAFRGNHCSWGTNRKPVELPDRLITDRVLPTLTYRVLRKRVCRLADLPRAARRAKQLLKGARPLVESDNKEVVTALREIAAGKVAVVEPEER